MLEIDGSFGEGGGQILRTAVALSAIKGEPVRITKIRAGRENPGLRPQHLKAVEALGLLCDADIDGLRIGSTEVSFSPGIIKAGRISVNIGTAGSITLLLQALLPVALKAPDEVIIDVSGGTDVSHSPTVDYFEHVFLPIVRSVGCDVEFEVLKRGFYPKGGGQVRLRTRPWNHSRRIDLIERRPFESVDVFSTATEHLRKQEVAERQVKGFLKKISPTHEVRHISRQYVESPSIGTSFLAVAKYDNTRVGVCVLGERGIKAEDVGEMAADGLLEEMSSDAPLDEHMADQIIPYLAMVGGEVNGSQITEHARTSVDVLRMFGYSIRLMGRTIQSDTI
ncbi:MAG: RNA 3'-terminal phosphate cyclase [Candidatus Altiarchaeota archaeon]